MTRLVTRLLGHRLVAWLSSSLIARHLIAALLTGDFVGDRLLRGLLPRGTIARLLARGLILPLVSPIEARVARKRCQWLVGHGPLRDRARDGTGRHDVCLCNGDGRVTRAPGLNRRLDLSHLNGLAASGECVVNHLRGAGHTGTGLVAVTHGVAGNYGVPSARPPLARGFIHRRLVIKRVNGHLAVLVRPTEGLCLALCLRPVAVRIDARTAKGAKHRAVRQLGTAMIAIHMSPDLVLLSLTLAAPYNASANAAEKPRVQAQRSTDSLCSRYPLFYFFVCEVAFRG